MLQTTIKTQNFIIQTNSKKGYLLEELPKSLQDKAYQNYLSYFELMERAKVRHIISKRFQSKINSLHFSFLQPVINVSDLHTQVFLKGEVSEINLIEKVVKGFKNRKLTRLFNQIKGNSHISISVEDTPYDMNISANICAIDRGFEDIAYDFQILFENALSDKLSRLSEEMSSDAFFLYEENASVYAILNKYPIEDICFDKKGQVL